MSALTERIVRPLLQNQYLLFLCVVQALHMMGSSMISPVLPIFAQTFGMGAAMVGVAIGAFGAGRTFINLPAGYLADRLGRRILLVGGPAVVTLGYFLSGLAPDFWQLVAYRFLTGLGSAIFTTGGMIFLTDISTPTNRGRMMAFYQGSLLLGVGLGPAPAGFIAQYFGYRAPFFLSALLSLLGTLWAALRIPETRDIGRESSGGEQSAAAQRIGLWVGLRMVVFDLSFLLINLVSLAIYFTRMGSRLGIIPLMAYNELGLSTSQLGLIFTFYSLINFLVLPLAGILPDRFGRKVIIVPTTALEGLGLFLYTLSDSFWPFLASTVLFALAAGLSGPVPAAYVADLARPEARGLTIGLYRSLNDVGYFVGPILMGWLADVAGYDWALNANALFLVLSALLFWAFARETLGWRRQPALRG